MRTTIENPPVFDADRALQDELDRAAAIADDAGTDILFEFAPELQERLAADEARTLAAVGRELMRQRTRRNEIAEYIRAVVEDASATKRGIDDRIRFLDSIVKDVLKTRRERDENDKSIDLPGIGKWTSRKVGDGWEIPESKSGAVEIIGVLTEDIIEDIAPKERVLHVSALRAHLDALLAPARDSLDARMALEERADRLSAVAEALVTIPGVTYRPERISYKGPVDA